MIKRINLSEQIYQALKSDILEQRIDFGQKLINRELQERFGVSSTPVRDATNRLQLDGLLDGITNVGARVIEFDAYRALKVNEIIAALHREAVALSIKNGHGDQLITTLDHCIKMQVESIDTNDYFTYDRMFHQSFFDYCDNEYLKKIYSQHSVLWEILVLYYYKNKDNIRERAIEDHRKILSAYIDGNVGTVQKYVEAHFQRAVKPLTIMASQAQG
ncbi:MAG: GntR family transcriptional regulator [Candidatus Fimivivens sp.]|nr:GntR family transcriptional regulator [Candidatus Fimivivens sp.]